MKVLVTVMPNLSGALSTRGPDVITPEVSRLDKLSNGLLSRAIHHGVFDDSKLKKKDREERSWCYLRPRFQGCGALMIWTESGRIDWESLSKIHPNGDFLLDSEVFEEGDLKKAEKHLGENARLRLWPGKGATD